MPDKQEATEKIISIQHLIAALGNGNPTLEQRLFGIDILTEYSKLLIQWRDGGKRGGRPLKHGGTEKQVKAREAKRSERERKAAQI